MSNRKPSEPRSVAQKVLEIEAAAVQGLVDQLDEAFDQAVELLKTTSGRVVCSGMGKSGIIMKKLAATLSSTGTPALFLHPCKTVFQIVCDILQKVPCMLECHGFGIFFILDLFEVEYLEPF